MRTGVPENLASLGVVEGNVGNLAVAFERTAQIPQLVVNLGDDHIGTQILGHVLEEMSRSILPGLGGDDRALSVAEVDGDIDIGVGLVLELLEVLLPQLFEEVVTLDNEVGERVYRRIDLIRRGFGQIWRGKERSMTTHHLEPLQAGQADLSYLRRP